MYIVLFNLRDDTINTDDLANFTVFIKTIVSFAQFKIKLCVCFSSLFDIDVLLSDYLGRGTVKNYTKFECRFNTNDAKRCPIFRIGYILQKLQVQGLKTNLTALYYEVIVEF